jgi:tRNA (cmo5U34)-methyltransferase
VDLNNKSSHMSEDYDLQIIDTIPYYESFHNETLNIIKVILERPNIWLDTGCGTGTLIQIKSLRVCLKFGLPK